MFCIEWTNKYSGEQGYVKEVKSKNSCFINTFEMVEAKTYKTTSAAEKAIDKLNQIGEGENNTFAIIEV